MTSNPTTTRWTLTLTHQALTGAARTSPMTVKGVLAATRRILSTAYGINVRKGTLADSSKDRLPEGFFVMRTLPATDVVFPEVHVPRTLDLDLACHDAGVDVDTWVKALATALEQTWGQSVRVFLDHGVPVSQPAPTH